MSRKLLVSDGRRERELVLVEKIVVGRDPACDLSHDDALLSRRHAEFIARADRVTVRDLGSRNGIFVNGLRAAEHALEPGDVVQIGPLRVRFAHDRKTAGILPEQLVSDATIVVPPPAPRPATPPSAPARAAVADQDDERTRVLSTAAMEPPRSLTPGLLPPAAIDPALQNGPTLFVAPPPAPRPNATAANPPAPPSVRHQAPGASRNLESDISGYVFGQVAIVGAVVFLASLVPLLIEGDTPLSAWVALPLVAALIASYLVSGLINRRVLRILRAMKPESPVGGDPFR